MTQIAPILIDQDRTEPLSEKGKIKTFLKERANAYSAMPNFHIRDIVRLLVDESFRKFGVLANEFVESFHEEEIAEHLVQKFIANIRFQSLNKKKVDTANEEFQSAQRGLRTFVEGYSSQEIKTTADYLRSLQDEHPTLNLAQLFDENLIRLFVRKVQEATDVIARSRFKEMYRANPDEAIRAYILPQILDTTLTKTPPIQVHVVNLMKTLEFLHEQKQLNDNDLYVAMYEYFKKHAILKIIEYGRPRIMTATRGSEKQGNEPEMKDDGRFDFDMFYKKYIVPYIEKFKREKLQTKKRKTASSPADSEIPLHKVMRISFGGMSENLLPPEAGDFIAKKLLAPDQIQDAYVQDSFGQEGRDLSSDLATAKKLIQWILAQGTPGNGNAEAIKQELAFIEEIMACTDVKELLRWMIYPASFLKKLPADRRQALIKKYSTNVLAVISHESRKILEFIKVYQKCSNIPNVKAKEEEKAKLEEGLKSKLKMEIGEIQEVKFQIRQKKTSPATQATTPAYSVIKDEAQMVDISTGEDPQEKDGFIYYEPESARFQKVTVNILDYTAGADVNAPQRKINLLVPVGEKNKIIHEKDIESVVSNFLREGKDIPDFTDLLRWTIIPETPGDYEYLKEYFHTVFNAKKTSTYNSPEVDAIAVPAEASDSLDSLDGPISLSGNGNNNEGKPGSVSAGSYRKHDRTILSQDFTPLGHHIVNFETQIVRNMDDYLCYSASKHTDTAHDKYRVIREKPTIKYVLHPPVIYGVGAIDLMQKLKF